MSQQVSSGMSLQQLTLCSRACRSIAFQPAGTMLGSRHINSSERSTADVPFQMAALRHDAFLAPTSKDHFHYCIKSAIGFLFMLCIAFLATALVLGGSPSQKWAWRSRSTVLDSNRAMSPSSKEESFMMSVQLLPAAQASAMPAYHDDTSECWDEGHSL